MKYIINPCNACIKKNQDGECNINDLNNCYSETLAAYQQYPNNFIILDGDAKDNWKQCMTNKMMKLPYVAGKPRTFCNFQLQPSPVFVGNHFFPQKLYENNGNADKALNECILECKNVKNKNECFINCKVDFDALEKVEKLEKYDKPKVLNKVSNDINQKQYSNKVSNDTDTTPEKSPSFCDIAKENPIIFYTIFLITTIFLSYILFVFISTLLSNKFGK